MPDIERRATSTRDMLAPSSQEIQNSGDLLNMLQEQHKVLLAQANAMQQITSILETNFSITKSTADIEEQISKIQSDDESSLLKKTLQYDRLLTAVQNRLAIEEDLHGQGSKEYETLLNQQKVIQDIGNAQYRQMSAAQQQAFDNRQTLEYYKERAKLAKENLETERDLAKERGDDKGATEAQRKIDLIDQREGSDSALGSIINAFTNAGNQRENAIAEALGESTEIQKAGFKNVTSGFKEVGKQLLSSLGAIGNALDKFVDGAAQFIAANKGQMNAALYGYGGIQTDWYDYFSDRSSALATSMMISQQDYLGNIKQLATQGIARDVEVSALLTTIADKTIPSFSATEGYLRRLWLLGEEESAQKYFGLESIIQASLNEQFGESSYLNQLFDSVNSTLMDSMNQLANSDKFSYLSSTQSWMSALYEQGVDSGTITKLANAINNLGSGNIAGMSGDAGMQKLLLLSMDKAGQDYAQLMQEGLTDVAVNSIMSSMTAYLKELANTTGKNNVLESAYANMFGLSMTDMYALSNFVTPQIAQVSDQTALDEVRTRLDVLGQGDTYISGSEKINNLLNNIQFDFGNELASNQITYFGWKGGQLISEIGSALALTNPGASKTLTTLGGAAMFASAIPALIDTGTDVVKNGINRIKTGENSVSQLYSDVLSTTDILSGVRQQQQNNAEGKTEAKTSYTKRFDATGAGEEYQITAEEYSESMTAEDPAVTILKEFEKTFMKNDSENYAVAVSLQGVGNEALKSFASIFADESSMEDLFSSKDAKNKLFNYGDEKDPTSRAKPSGKNSGGNGNNGGGNNGSGNNGGGETDNPGVKTESGAGGTLEVSASGRTYTGTNLSLYGGAGAK